MRVSVSFGLPTFPTTHTCYFAVQILTLAALYIPPTKRQVDYDPNYDPDTDPDFGTGDGEDDLVRKFFAQSLLQLRSLTLQAAGALSTP